MLCAVGACLKEFTSATSSGFRFVIVLGIDVRTLSQERYADLSGFFAWPQENIRLGFPVKG